MTEQTENPPGATPSDMKTCINDHLRKDARVPLSTYRLQMHAGFSFGDGAAIVGYLKQLGIGDYYSSPFFEARPGSTHGYDVARHDRLNPELGGEAGFERLSRVLKDAGMGLLLDIVPNHMGVGNDSLWWQDVLENGRSSEFAEFFDIDWSPLKPDMQGKLLLPILGNQYGVELEAGNIKVDVDAGRVLVRYFEHTMPTAPRSLPILFPEEEHDELNIPQEFRDLLRELVHVPPHDTADPALAAQRRDQLPDLKPRIENALRSETMQPAIRIALDRINGVVPAGSAAEDPTRFDRLHALLEVQPYRLAFWRVSSEEINYRRFFDVNDLVGLRMENPAVFRETHCLIRAMLARHQITGLRIDHCDGMFNPRQYLIRLQMLAIASQCAGLSPTGAAPTAPTTASGIEVEIREALRGYDWTESQGPLYTVVEKILEPRESLPGEWPVRGTSGYDFVYQCNEVFIQTRNEDRFNALYESFIGRRVDPDEIIYRSKLQVMQTSLASEVYVLTNLLSQMAATNRRVRDFTDNILEAVIRETIACFPVYRTYIDDRGRYTDRDRTFIRYAIARGKRANRDLDTSAFDFLRDTLLLGGGLLRGRKDAGGDIDPRQLYFALKFQQLTGPVMAKGVEDTSFYVYNRFISSNEVGGSMKAFGITPEVFHASNQDRLDHSPDAMVTTSTHDTKRSEDVRARLNVISELPAEWSAAVRRWQRMNARFKRKLDDGRIAPDANEEYLLYQTIAGAWPWQMETLDDRRAFLDRVKEYASKALSEAKVNLSWMDPNPAYVEAVHAFLEDILIPAPRARETRFVETLKTILPQLQLFGGINALAQTVLKVASPGVPDFYQGTEMWDLALVDPDNRRPVDYALRSAALDALQTRASGSTSESPTRKRVPHAWPLSGHEWDPNEAQEQISLCEDLLANFHDGRAKLWTTHRALALRQQHHEVFRRGSYTPLAIENDKQQHAIAFLRSLPATTLVAGNSVLAVAPRFACTLMKGKAAMPLGEAWGNASITLPEGADSFLNVYTGDRVTVDASRTLPLREIFAHFPVALLISG